MRNKIKLPKKIPILFHNCILLSYNITYSTCTCKIK